MAPASVPLTMVIVPRSQTGSTHTISVDGEGTLLVDARRAETWMFVVSCGQVLGDSRSPARSRGRSAMVSRTRQRRFSAGLNGHRVVEMRTRSPFDLRAK